jgi:hypothetical protein
MTLHAPAGGLECAAQHFLEHEDQHVVDGCQGDLLALHFELFFNCIVLFHFYNTCEEVWTAHNRVAGDKLRVFCVTTSNFFDGISTQLYLLEVLIRDAT